MAFQKDPFVEILFMEDTCYLMTMVMFVMLYHWTPSRAVVRKKDRSFLAMDATFFHSVATRMSFVFHAAYILLEHKRNMY